MTWSLRLQNGDLALGNGSYVSVTGEEKLVQDLRTYILERMGTDDMHPEFGSLLNGGRKSDGTEVPGVIGLRNDDFVQLEIESEIRRLVGEYQKRQLARAKDDKFTYGKATLTQNEVLLSLSEIQFQNQADVLNVHLTLRTSTGIQPLDLEIPLA